MQPGHWGWALFYFLHWTVFLTGMLLKKAFHLRNLHVSDSKAFKGSNRELQGRPHFFSNFQGRIDCNLIIYQNNKVTVHEPWTSRMKWKRGLSPTRKVHIVIKNMPKRALNWRTVISLYLLRLINNAFKHWDGSMIQPNQKLLASIVGTYNGALLSYPENLQSAVLPQNSPTNITTSGPTSLFLPLTMSWLSPDHRISTGPKKWDRQRVGSFDQPRVEAAAAAACRRKSCQEQSRVLLEKVTVS